MHKIIIYFDGVCYLCNSLVNFLIKIDTKKRIKFSPLQSNFARKELEKSQLNLDEIDSIIVQIGEKYYIKSNAVIAIIKELSWYWRILLIIRLIPTRFADNIYDYIAKNRFNWFGKKDKCMIPSLEIRSRFTTE